MYYARAMRPRYITFTSEHHLTFRYIRITHVCHHWREVALSSPRLWSYIDVGSLGRTQEFLARSKATLLSIKAKHSFASFDALVQVFREFSRIQEIHLTLLEENYAKLSSIFPEEAAHLRRVTLYYEGHISNLPTVFDKCALPSLAELRLERYSLSSKHIFVPSLTRLVIHDTRWPDDTVDRLLDVLRNLQDLQHLELLRAGSPVNELKDESITHASRVTLPKLASLRLRHTFTECVYILRHLVFPSNANINVGLHLAYPREQVDIAQLLPVIFDILSGNGTLGPRLPILSAGLWMGERALPGPKLACWKRDVQFGLFDEADFRISFYNVPFPSVHRDFGAMVPSEEIVTFQLRGDAPTHHPRLDWFQVLRTMPNLQALRVEDLRFTNLLEILSPLDNEDNPRDDGYTPDFLMKSLTCLEICRTAFPFDGEHAYVENLVKLLLSREKACGALSSLKFERCFNFYDVDFDKLRVADGVESAEWDEEEDYKDIDRSELSEEEVRSDDYEEEDY